MEQAKINKLISSRIFTFRPPHTFSWDEQKKKKKKRQKTNKQKSTHTKKEKIKNKKKIVWVDLSKSPM